jgi:hypothetical protein
VSPVRHAHGEVAMHCSLRRAWRIDSRSRSASSGVSGRRLLASHTLVLSLLLPLIGCEHLAFAAAVTAAFCSHLCELIHGAVLVLAGRAMQPYRR